MSGSLIYTCEAHWSIPAKLTFFPYWKFAFLQPCGTSPFCHYFSEITVVNSEVPSPSLSKPGINSSWPALGVLYLPTYRWLQFSVKRIYSAPSSLKIILFDAEDRQHRNGMVLPCFCRLLSPSVSSRGLTPSCLFLLISRTFKCPSFSLIIL